VSRQGLSDVATWLTERGGRSAIEAAGRLVSGDPVNGQRLYSKTCAGCHGAKGEGKEGPAIGNAEFLSAATDGFLQATIIRGRHQTAMPEFNRDQVKYPRLSAGEVDDIVSFIRSLMGGEKEEN
jgi:mono/diheme cytochrome c family protein